MPQEGSVPDKHFNARTTPPQRPLNAAQALGGVVAAFVWRSSGVHSTSESASATESRKESDDG